MKYIKLKHYSRIRVIRIVFSSILSAIKIINNNKANKISYGKLNLQNMVIEK